MLKQKYLLTLLVIFSAFLSYVNLNYAQEPRERELKPSVRELKQKERERQLRERQEFETIKYFSSKITQAEEEEILRKINEENLRQVEDLERLKKEKPMAYYEILYKTQRELEHLARLEEEDPERYELKKKQRSLDIKSHKLANQYKATSKENEKKEIKKELMNVLNELFDMREADRKEEIKRLNNRLEELKSILAKREQMKKDIIERRFKELTGQIEELVW